MIRDYDVLNSPKESLDFRKIEWIYFEPSIFVATHDYAVVVDLWQQIKIPIK